MRTQAPLIYFVGIASGRYNAHYPVWLKSEDPAQLEFAVALDETQLLLRPATLSPAERKYVLALTRRRLHQPAFRARVLLAYGDSCAMCRLRHAELLDAAHILPDTHPRGLPVVPNGLALCKIHHAAYDANIIGVRRDLTIEVQSKVLHEIDGPMLRHGLQELAGARLIVPSSKREKPDPDRLHERYGAFRLAG